MKRKYFRLKAGRFLKKKLKTKQNPKSLHPNPKSYIRKVIVALMSSRVDTQGREKFASFLVRDSRSCQTGINNKFYTTGFYSISVDFYWGKYIYMYI